MLQFLTNQDNNNYNTARPKAFLNYVAFNNRLNMVDANSGVVQVPEILGADTAQPLVVPELVLQKNGYIYIYLSNESAQSVFFDNLVIHHKRGSLLQETEYYPFGLTMAGISDKAALRMENNYLFNGKLLNHDEFSDGEGLDWYSYGMREYDPQIGRFFRIDPLASKYTYLTPYQFASDKPVKYIDLDGAEAVESPYLYAEPAEVEDEGYRKRSIFSIGKDESSIYFEPREDLSEPLITKGNKIGKFVTALGKGLDDLIKNVVSVTESQNIFYTSNGRSVSNNPVTITFKDKKSELRFMQKQAAFEKKVKTAIDNIPKPEKPGPNATRFEKSQYHQAMKGYRAEVGLTKAIMEARSPKQKIINSIKNNPNTKKTTTIKPLPIIRPDKHNY